MSFLIIQIRIEIIGFDFFFLFWFFQMLWIDKIFYDNFGVKRNYRRKKDLIYK